MKIPLVCVTIQTLPSGLPGVSSSARCAEGAPVVVQPVEEYNGGVIAYSLGNFLFDGFTDKASTTGWLVRLEMDRDGVRHWRSLTA